MIRRLESGTAPWFKQRLMAIRGDTRPAWGKLTPARLMAHLRFSLQVSLGEIEVEDTSNVFMRTVGRVLAFHLFKKWPGGKIKAPDDWTPEPAAEFEAERDQALAALDRFVEAATLDPTRRTISPLLGPITLDYWQHVHGVHMAHHFRQFGV